MSLQEHLTKKKEDLIIKIQQDIMDDAATVFFGYETTYLFFNKRVTGVKMYPRITTG